MWWFQVRVNISDANDPPVLTSPTTITVDENSGLGSTVANITAADQDVLDILRYTIIGGNVNTGAAGSPAAFSLGLLTGKLSPASVRAPSARLASRFLLPSRTPLYGSAWLLVIALATHRLLWPSLEMKRTCT